MKNILILSGKRRGKLHTSKIPQDLVKNLQKYSKSNILQSHFDRLQLSVLNGTLDVFDTVNNRSLTDYDLVYLRSWGRSRFTAEAQCVALYLQHHDVSFVDREALYVSGNKLTTYFKLALHNIPVPDTLYARQTKLLEGLITKHHFRFPFILKDVAGRKGRNNYLIQNKTQLRTILRKKRHRRFVVQRYIENDYDFRCLVLGEKVGTLSKRSRHNTNDHRNNAALGATEEEVSVNFFDQRAVNDAVKAAKLLHRQIAGVDVVIEKKTGKHYILEVNSAPGFTYDTSVLSEAPQVSQYLDHVVEKQ